MFTEKSEAPLCACGCGNKVGWDKWAKKWNKFIIGHHRKGFICSEETRKRMTIANTGRKHSEEAKKKISLARQGNSSWNKDISCSGATKQKISKSLLGNEISEECRGKISVANKGRNTWSKGSKRTPEICKQMSIANAGSGNPNWQGGIAAEPYCILWRDAEYKQSILERDNYECQNPNCWGIWKRLNIHHINYNKKDCCPTNLITLCVSCNMRANYNREYWTKFYQELMRELL